MGSQVGSLCEGFLCEGFVLVQAVYPNFVGSLCEGFLTVQLSTGVCW